MHLWSVNKQKLKKNIMPLDPVTGAALIYGGSALLGGGANALSQGNMNKKNRRWSEKMYQRQYNDNLAFWAMQNDYNSPQAQMRRFQEAGLNPNLIYGQGNAGNAGSVQTPDIQGTDQRAPQWGDAFTGAAGGIAAYYDTRIKQATADNLEEQNTNLVKTGLLTEAQILNTIGNTDMTKFDLDQKIRLKDISAQAAAANLRKLETETDLAINRDYREALKNTSDLAEAAERVLTMRLGRAKTSQEIQNLETQNAQVRQQISLMKQDGTLKQLEIQLRRKGINPNDPMYMRILAQGLEQIVNNPQTAQQKIKKLTDTIWNMLF